MDKKGFFFTVVVLVLLSFLIISVSMWSKVIEAKERRAPEKYKAEAIALVLDELTDEKMSSFANISAHYALYRLDTHTYSHAHEQVDLRLKEKSGDGPDFIVEVNRSIYDLMEEGNTSASNWAEQHYLNYSSKEEWAEYTLAGWEKALKSACKEIKLNLSVGEMENFTFEQTDWWTVSVHFNIQVNVTYEDGSMKMSRNLTADASFPIEGFVDPMIACGSMVQSVDIPDCGYNGTGSWMAPERQIFRNLNYDDPSHASPILVGGPQTTFDTYEGEGWFFGEMTTNPCDFSDPDAMLKVLVTGYFDNKECGGENISLGGIADLFGGVIVTERPQPNDTRIFLPQCNYTERRQTRCLDCIIDYVDFEPASPPASCPKQPGDVDLYDNQVTVPFIAVGGSGWRNGIPEAWEYTHTPRKKVQHVLFDNKYEGWVRKRDGYHRIWNIEPLRAFVLCGFYVGVDDAPSFLQRFTDEGYKLKGGNKFGIETFVEGLWAGGPLDEPKRDRNKVYSRVGHVFYEEDTGTIDDKMRVKGMPGCKSKDMCTLYYVPDDYKAACLGRFAMDKEDMERYSLDEDSNITKIMCDPGEGASCDVQ